MYPANHVLYNLLSVNKWHSSLLDLIWDWSWWQPHTWRWQYFGGYLNPVPSSVLGEAAGTSTKLTQQVPPCGSRPPSQSSVLLMGPTHFCMQQTPQSVVSALESRRKVICRENKMTLSWFIGRKGKQSRSKGWAKTLSLVQQKESLTSSTDTFTKTFGAGLPPTLQVMQDMEMMTVPSMGIPAKT